MTEQIKTSTAEMSSPYQPLVDAPSPGGMRSGNPRIFRLVMVTIALAAIFLIIYGLATGTGSLSDPDSGMLLLILGIIILFCTPMAWVRKEVFEVFNTQRVGHAVAMVAGLILFVATYWLFGFYIAGALGLIVITRWSAVESWRNTLLVSLITPAVLYLIFATAFNVAMSLLPGWL